MMNQDDKLNLIKDILLTDEREFSSAIEKKINALEDIINKKKNLSPKVDPIVDEKIEQFVKDIPKTLGPTITQTLKEEIKNSQDAVVEALYPILGKMIKRFIQNEMKILSEKINNQVNNAFSFKGFFRKFKSKFSGVKDADLLLQEQTKPIIEQIIVIEKGSGIVLGESHENKMIDEDMVAGMLTAIKSFVEDAFSKENQNLQQIEYDLYTIHLQNFSSYYIAIIISGVYNVIFKNKLEDHLLEFASEHLNSKILKNKVLLTKKLKEHFKDDDI